MAYEMRISDWSSDVCSSDLVMGRFGLGYEDVKKTNPKAVYLSVTGFGQSGPNSKLPTTDSVIQAYSGWMTLHRDSEGVPMRSGIIAVDVMTGLYAFGALSSAILKQIGRAPWRERGCQFV